MINIVIVYAEKPSVGVNLAAFIGGCRINGQILNTKMIENKQFEKAIKTECSKKGYLECSSENKKYIVTWGYGHMASLKLPKDYNKKYVKWTIEDYPFIPKSFDIKLRKNINSQFNTIKTLFNNSETEYIICATDYDREGSLIFDYIYRLCNCDKPWKRLIIHSNEEKDLKKSFNQLKNSNDVMNVVYAGRCRAIADYLVGINMSVLATLKFGGYNNVISIGRVQTPTLSLVVQRDLSIKDFKSKEYYQLEGEFNYNSIKYKGVLIDENNEILSLDKPNLFNELIKYFKNINKGKIINYDKKTEREKPPLLYDLTELQKSANKKYGLTAAQTLKIAQSLYEKKFITYPRTNSRYLPTSINSSIGDIINNLPSVYDKFKNKLSIDVMNKRVFNDSKVESHYALIPTTKTPLNNDLNTNEIKIYGLICRRLIKVFLPDALWQKIKIKTLVGDKLFITNNKKLIEKGWKVAEKTLNKNKDNIIPNSDLHLMNEGNIVNTISFNLLNKETNPPKHFTEDTLLSAMETAGKFVTDEDLREAMKKNGLGTPATRASILEKLIEVGYLERKGKSIIATEKGIEIIKCFPIEELKSPKLTGNWEFRLNKVEKGEESALNFNKDIIKFTLDISKKLKSLDVKKINFSSIGKCPKCHGDIIQIKTKDKRFFYSCNNYRNKSIKCNFIISGEICGKKISTSTVRTLLKNKKSNKLKGFKYNGKEFDACLILDMKDFKVKFKSNKNK